MRSIHKFALAGFIFAAWFLMLQPDLYAQGDHFRRGAIRFVTSPGAEILIEQVRQDFQFGAPLVRDAWLAAWPAAERENYLNAFAGSFSAASFFAELDWVNAEKTRDRPDYVFADRILRWSIDQGIEMRGPVVVSGLTAGLPPWFRGAQAGDMPVRIERRIRNLLNHFRGRISRYDLAGSFVNGSFITDKLGEDIYPRMFEWARSADPNALYYIYDRIDPGTADADKFVSLLDRLHSKGLRADGISLHALIKNDQSVSGLIKFLDTMQGRSLPVNIILSVTALEPDQSRLFEEAARACYLHPAAEGLFLPWFGRKGGPLKPGQQDDSAALYLHDEAWAPTAIVNIWQGLFSGDTIRITADEEGRAEARPLFGKIRIHAGGKSVEVDLKRGEPVNTLIL